MIIRTVVFPLNPTAEQVHAMAETLDLYTQAWQHCVDVAWKMEKPFSVAVHKKTYYHLKETLGLKSQFLCSARNRAVESVKSAKDRAKKKKRVQKPSSNRIPVRLDARTLSFDKTRETVSFTTQTGRLKLQLLWHPQAQRYKGWNCKSGEYTLNRKGKWVLRLHFETSDPCVVSTGKGVGLDRGIRHPVVASNNLFLGNPFWKEHERKLLSLRSKLQSKGTKSAKRKLKKISGRLRRFKVDCDRNVAKQIVSSLNPGDTIVIENLTNIRERTGKKRQNIKRNRANIGRWSFKRLENSLTNLAELHGNSIEKIDPRYTSQTCSVCGLAKKSNRKSQSLYLCECGNRLNADLNASRNIVNLWLSATCEMSGPPVNRPIVAPVSIEGSYKPLPSGSGC